MKTDTDWLRNSLSLKKSLCFNFKRVLKDSWFSVKNKNKTKTYRFSCASLATFITAKKNK